jgi:hypothetical protein
MNSAFSGCYVYVYQATDTMTYPLLSQITKFTLSHFTIQSLYTINISAVVMLLFWLCQFNVGCLVWRLYLSSSYKYIVWLFEFNIYDLG